VKALDLSVGLRVTDPPEDQFNVLLDEKDGEARHPTTL
jgi:hypothetical protein